MMTPKTTRVDWNAALGYWLNLPPTERTFTRVAAEYGVRVDTVRKHAHAGGWLEALVAVDREARDAVEQAGQKSAKDRAVQTARLRDAAADAIEKKLNVDVGALPDLDDAVLARIFADADKMTRLDDGAATDHIAIFEVQRTLADFVIRIGRFVSTEHREAFLTEVRAFSLDRRAGPTDGELDDGEAYGATFVGNR